jgi:hypothetical protein
VAFGHRVTPDGATHGAGFLARDAVPVWWATFLWLLPRLGPIRAVGPPCVMLAIMVLPD